MGKITADGSIYLQGLSGNEIAEVNTPGASVQEDIYAGSRHLAIYASNSTYFFDSDQVGTERLRTGPAGSVNQTCTSMPFGDNQSCTGGTALSRFAGYDRDAEYGLAHAPARYYSPGLGRFMTPDPLEDPMGNRAGIPGPADNPVAGPGAFGADTSLPQSWNRYAYVLNNPATFIDPLGLCHQVGQVVVCIVTSSSGGGGEGGGGGGGTAAGICTPWTCQSGTVTPYQPPPQTPWTGPSGTVVPYQAPPTPPGGGDVPVGMDIWHSSRQCPNCGQIWSSAGGAVNGLWYATLGVAALPYSVIEGPAAYEAIGGYRGLQVSTMRVAARAAMLSLGMSPPSGIPEQIGYWIAWWFEP